MLKLGVSGEDDRGKVTGVIESYGGKDLKLSKIK